MREEWYYKTGDEKPVGPVSGSELRQRAANSQLLPTDMVWKDGMVAWVSASSLKGLFNSNPVPPTAPNSLPPGRDSRRPTAEGFVVWDDSSMRASPTQVSIALTAITASELGISSAALGAITLLGECFSLVSALASGLGSATLMLVLHCLLAILAGFLGVMGLMTALRKGQAGGSYSIVGLCVSILAFISSIMFLSALTSVKGHF